MQICTECSAIPCATINRGNNFPSSFFFLNFIRKNTNLRKGPPSKSVEFSFKIERGRKASAREPPHFSVGLSSNNSADCDDTFTKADAHDENKIRRVGCSSLEKYSAAFSMINSHNARDRQVTRALCTPRVSVAVTRVYAPRDRKQRHEIIELRTGRLFSPRPTLRWPEIEVEREKERARKRVRGNHVGNSLEEHVPLCGNALLNESGQSR